MDLPDCQECAACCFARGPEHVPLTGEDHARLTVEEQRELTVFRGNRCFMKVDADRCINLRQSEGRFECAIYERRPQVCRSYERGDGACSFDRERVYGGRSS